MSPVLRVLLTGILFATGGAMIKSCDFPSLERAALRAAIAAVTIFALLPQTRRWPTRGTMLLLLPYFGATCLFVVANTLTTAANTIFLQATAPLWVAMLGPLLLHEKPTRRDLLTMLGIVCGMSLFFVAPEVESATAPSPRLGDLIALGTGLSFGLLLLGIRWLSRQGRDEAPLAIAWGNAFTAPMAAMLMPVFGQEWTAGTGNDWAVMIYLGVVQVGIAYALLVRAAKQIPAVTVSLILMVEPALNPVIAFAVHGETPHPLAIAGGALIVASVAGAALSARRRG